MCKLYLKCTSVQVVLQIYRVRRLYWKYNGCAGCIGNSYNRHFGSYIYDLQRELRMAKS